ncbi:MAG: CAP domain-containing protein [Bacteroidota bacterium]
MKKITFPLFFTLIAFTGLFAQNTSGNRSALVDFDGFSNKEYAAFLNKDGWPVDSLNTGAAANYLSDEEKNLVLAMNLIRYDPAKYAELYVLQRFEYYSGNLFHFPGKTPTRTSEGVKAAEELYAELKNAESMPVFYPSEGMSKGSEDHALYMKRTGITSHKGQGGMSKRVSKYGEWKGALAENLQWGTSNAHEAIISLMIDDGIPGRGHRVNAMNPTYTKVGVAIAPHPEYRISYVINFANDYIEK